MTDQSVSSKTRRQFLQNTAVGAATILTFPAIATASKTDRKTIVGSGEYEYEVTHMWPQLPDKFHWQTTHNVAVDSEGLLYVIHQGLLNESEHPSVFVFDSEGNYVRSFGNQFQGGGHGIEVRNEEGQDFLYICSYQQQRSIAKLDTKGEQVWRQGAPMESGLYADGENQFPRNKDDNPWGRDRFHPTNIAFHPNGGFFVIDGYGAYRIHYYDRQDRWSSTLGSPGNEEKADGTFNLPHGIWVDQRDADNPKIVVADRVNARLQWFTFLGEHLQTLDGFLLPANIDTYGELMVVPDLVGRVTLLDGNNNVIAHLGEDSARIQADQKEHDGFHIRTDESTWQDGKFIHPHDACFDRDGNIFVAEWVERGRVTRLRRLS